VPRLIAAMPDLQSLGGILVALGAMVAAIRRKHAIGGWLFYFFWQVLLGLALTVANTHWKLYLPREWSGPAPYFLFTLSSLSRVALFAAIAVVCVRAVETREWRWVCGLQYALLTYAFLTVLKLPVDIYCLRAALARDGLSLTFPCVWIAYFGVSRRVRQVFADGRRLPLWHGDQ